MVFPIKEIFGPKKLDDFPDRFLFARSLLDQFQRRKRFPPVRGASFLSVLIAHISYLLCSLDCDALAVLLYTPPPVFRFKNNKGMVQDDRRGVDS